MLSSHLATSIILHYRQVFSINFPLPSELSHKTREISQKTWEFFQKTWEFFHKTWEIFCCPSWRGTSMLLRGALNA